MEGLFGRKQIFTDVNEITSENLLGVINNSMVEHEINRQRIDYLYKYAKGEQPILNRKKEVRADICNKVVENRANEIVAFKTGHICGEPIQYVSRSADAGVSQNIMLLNDLMVLDGKSSKDKTLVEWAMIGGTAYRMILAGEGDALFETVTTDPRCSYVIYSSKIGHKPLAGVYYVTDRNGNKTISVYTPNKYFEIKEGKIVKNEPHALGMVPLIEYPANMARLGAFEIVIPILDAINTVSSNRIDGVEQFVQSLMKFVNCEIDEEKFVELQQMGAIMIKSADGQHADVEIMTQELNQAQTETLMQHMYDSVLTICGMPNRNGGSSTSDTGSAVIMRDGWSAAEARAKDYEEIFKESERRALKCILRYCETKFALSPLDIDIKFTRRNYENIQTKAQVLCEMLNSGKIAPRLAFVSCGLFSDPEEAYQESKPWIDSYMKQLEAPKGSNNE